LQTIGVKPLAQGLSTTKKLGAFVQIFLFLNYEQVLMKLHEQIKSTFIIICLPFPF